MLHPAVRVRLERRLSADVNERLDLLLSFDRMSVAVEVLGVRRGEFRWTSAVVAPTADGAVPLTPQ